MFVPISKKSIKDLENFTGVYSFLKKGKPIYIGKSINVKARLLSHLENATVDKKERLIALNSDSIQTFKTDSEFKALVLESKLIQTHHPKYNVRWRDDKSYLYVGITTSAEYPKIALVRGKDRNKENTFIGPFPSKKSIEEMLASIRRAFPFCEQKNISKHACFYSKIGLCSPCPSQIIKTKGPKEKQFLKRTYRYNIRQIIKILKGDVDNVIKSLNKKMSVYAAAREFEKALEVRNRMFRLDRLIRQRLFNADTMRDFDRSRSGILELMKILTPYFVQLNRLNRIECYDVSNLYFKQGTASMAVAIDGYITRNEYKKFMIKKPYSRSDFEMLEEVITRRFLNKWHKPDLIVVDGGKPQIKAIDKVVAKYHLGIPIVGIAKNPDRIIVGSSKNYTTVKPVKSNLGFQMLLALRDESHRFAKKYHVQLRKKQYVREIDPVA